MKQLQLFRSFELDKFLAGKTLLFIKALPLQERDGETVRTIGTRVSLFILKDSTDYGRPEAAEANKGETLIVKVPGVSPDQFASFEYMETVCVVTSVQKATIWGDFNNNLSVTASVDKSKSQQN
jgi:hypothetical protein